VVGPAIATARVVVPQSDIALVRDRTEAVEVRLSRRVGETFPAVISRQVPAATDRLPSRALGTAGGGRVPVDPHDPEGLRTLERVFQLDVALPQEAAVAEIGGRVYVRFDHGSEPLAAQGYRALRRLFLRRIGV
jgi:putative peptide zinc metalloprotease protein